MVKPPNCITGGLIKLVQKHYLPKMLMGWGWLIKLVQKHYFLKMSMGWGWLIKLVQKQYFPKEQAPYQIKTDEGSVPASCSTPTSTPAPTKRQIQPTNSIPDQDRWGLCTIFMFHPHLDPRAPSKRQQPTANGAARRNARSDWIKLLKNR